MFNEAMIQPGLFRAEIVAAGSIGRGLSMLLPLFSGFLDNTVVDILGDQTIVQCTPCDDDMGNWEYLREFVYCGVASVAVSLRCLPLAAEFLLGDEQLRRHRVAEYFDRGVVGLLVFVVVDFFFAKPDVRDFVGKGEDSTIDTVSTVDENQRSIFVD